MKRSAIPFSTGITMLAVTVVVAGCCGPKRDGTAAFDTQRNEAVGAPAANGNRQVGSDSSGLNQGDSSRQNTDESEPPRRPEE